MTKSILVVDDSEMERLLIANLLTSHGDYEITMAADGREALEILADGDVDLVITDMVMPTIDGLELIRAMRTEHGTVPAVLLTAYGDESIAVEALQCGAASYVPKARQAQCLPGTVERVLEHAEAEHRCNRLDRCTLEFEWRLALENDPQLIRTLVDRVEAQMGSVDFGDCIERIRVGEALEEALLNAMVHGNRVPDDREPDEQCKTPNEGECDSFDDPSVLADPDKQRILVKVHVTPEMVRFNIRDEGYGFTVKAVTQRNLESSFQQGRRGLTLIHSIMDDVRFNSTGNELTMSRQRAKTPAAV